tara:strand:+ start:252 stop:689 length:438 start_codon:yes stop_codon:yes gene_type:complete
MLKKIEKQILEFAKDTGLTQRREIVHGTLYVTLHEEKECDTFHRAIRTFYKNQINNEGGVNMYAVGDEFAFDFVPEDREAPVFVEPYSEEKYSGKEIMDPTDIDDKGIWSEFAEEEMFNNIDLTDEQESELDVLMNLEAESKRGK